MIPTEFSTTHLSLRPFDPTDAGDVFAYWSSDPSWERFNASVPEDFTLADAEDFVERMRERDRRAAPNWALVNEGKVMGVVSLVFEENQQIAVLGYGIHSDLRGRGLTLEAVSAVIDLAFEHHGSLQRIRAHTDPENLASRRVLEKLGFTHEGTLRQNQFVKGRLVDEAIYGILRQEWQASGDVIPHQEHFPGEK